ncbi:hypothetical protein YS9_2778 [Enterococcus sp. C1]|nr:hypothetical protein YS9_2778 [Enterococcus sp. C1]
METKRNRRNYSIPMVLIISLVIANGIILSGSYVYLIGIILIMLILILKYLRK